MSDNLEPPRTPPTPFSPREFLKARRPEKFSDSVTYDEPVLDRTILEYQLETVTNRNQDVAFATFARHLAEREICPNLLPQTGPTGGGDSKVDSETYPIADTLALGWYEGMSREAASERWGFAFSAKKKWRDKVISDVEKAVGTGRGYRKLFFVTNQYVRDRSRSEVEDNLSRKHCVDVRILDRTWILDKVFQNHRENLAIEDLQLSTSTRPQKRKGPLDSKREDDLRETDERIQKALEEGRLGLQLVEDSINSADLARELESPRLEVIGRYQRAEEIAKKCGTDHQRLKCAYQWAWTSYWWYEDYQRASELYETVEKLAKGTANAYDLELLSNLWGVLCTAVAQSKLDEAASHMHTRTDTLAAELERLSQRDEQPSATLYAKMLRVQMDLTQNRLAGKPIGSILSQIKDLILNCEGLSGFPLEPFVKVIQELGKYIQGSPEYDQLFDVIVQVETRHKGDIAAARLLSNRGAQELDGDRPYEAIRLLGLSFGRLYKHESRMEAVLALYLCGCAYERVGLFWAARGILLSAASLATNELWQYGTINYSQSACYGKLKWLELRLGRLPHILSWHEVHTVSRALLSEKKGEATQIADEDVSFDGVLGMLLLRTEYWNLNRICMLPDVLDRLGLFNSAVALKYALGHEDELIGTYFNNEESSEVIHDFFLNWRKQPAARDLPTIPELYDERKVTLKSLLLGCDITIVSENVPPCVELAESILAGLESLLSTATVKWMAAREPLLNLSIRSSRLADNPFEFKLQDITGRPEIEILCSIFDPHVMTAEFQNVYKKKLFELLSTVVVRTFGAHDLLNTLEVLVRDELAFDRSLNFSGSFVTVANVLGRKPKHSLSSWTVSGVRSYSIKRKCAWDADDVTERFELKQGEKAITEDGVANVKQSAIRTFSLIRESLWDKAKWVGTVFAVDPLDAKPPILSIGFKDPEAGKQILRCWHDEIGKEDIEGQLRVTIVRGINTAEPYSYRVLIGSNPDAHSETPGVQYAAFVARVNTMRPSSNSNLQKFLQKYESIGSYFVGAAVVREKDSKWDLLYDSFILKRQLHIREAWQIGVNDPDSSAIHVDDTPHIPSDEKNAPVLALLQRKRR